MALGGVNPFFTIYGRITDNLMYFDDRYNLQFSVQLLRKNMEGRAVPFHSEYKYFSQGFDQDIISIKRQFYYGYVINDSMDYMKSINIQPKDLPPFQFIFRDKILKWFMGDRKNKVFDFIDDKLEVINNGIVEIPMSEYSFIAFSPLVVEFGEGGDRKQGCRMYINSYENYVDMTVDKFMEFYQYICNTDMYNCALNMLTYVKSEPYGVNLNERGSRQGSSYFNKK